VSKRFLSRFRLFPLALLLMVVPASLGAQVSITVGFAPPPLPVYTQPPCPAEGYVWTPGYWAYSGESYYWVPGTWVLVPVTGYLWTPGYWGWGGNGYLWHAGYWGPQVGYYGGIDYGYGYPGEGYYGGYWRDRQFYYNRAVSNVNVTNIHNVYTRKVVNNVNVTRVSYNGGRGGVTARPTAAQEAAMRARHVAATSTQVQHENAARQDRSLFATVNHGRPAIAATPKPTVFHGAGVMAARNAPMKTTPPAHGAAARPNEANVPRLGTPAAKASRPETRAPAPERENSRGAAAPRPENQPRPHENAPAAAKTPKEAPRPPAQTNERSSARGEQPRESAPPREVAPAPRETGHPAAAETPRPPARSEAPPPREASRPAPAESPRPAPHVNEPEERAERPAPAAPHEAAPRPAQPPAHEAAPRPAEPQAHEAAPRPAQPQAHEAAPKPEERH